MIRSRFVRKSGKPGAKRRPKTVLLLGAKSIGKTSLIKRFIDGSFPSSLPATVEDRFQYDLSGSNQLYCEIVDIDAFEFPPMRDLNIKEACVIVLLYEAKNRKSFDVMKKLYSIITSVRDDPVPLVVLATKTDKLDSGEMMNEVKEHHVDEFVLDLNSSSSADGVRHMNTSAKLGYNVSEAFGVAFTEVKNVFQNESLAGGSLGFTDQEDGDRSKCCCTLI